VTEYLLIRPLIPKPLAIDADYVQAFLDLLTLLKRFSWTVSTLCIMPMRDPGRDTFTDETAKCIGAVRYERKISGLGPSRLTDIMAAPPKFNRTKFREGAYL
jgi:hypothetical protein